MKRNSIFMWAYITFIFLAIIVRLCFDYPLWAPIVMAVTLSSVLFAIEDLYASLAKTLSDACDNKENFAPTAREKAEKTLAFHEKAIKHINCFENMKYDIPEIQELQELQKALERNRDRLTNMIQVFSDIEQKAVRDREIQKGYLKHAAFLAYLGFLSLFCTLIFASFITRLTDVQEVATVFSFFVILITRQINIDKSLKIKEDMLKYQDIIRDQEEIEAEIPNAEKDINALIKLVDIPASQPKEVSTNAN